MNEEKVSFDVVVKIFDEKKGKSYEMKLLHESSDHFFYEYEVVIADKRYDVQLRLDPRGDKRGKLVLDVDYYEWNGETRERRRRRKWHHPEVREYNGEKYYEYIIPNISSKRIVIKGKFWTGIFNESISIGESFGVLKNGKVKKEMG